MSPAAPHAQPVEAVGLELAADPEWGLSDDSAAERLAEAGPNRLRPPASPRYGAIAVRQLLDPLVALLIAAAVVSAAIGEGLEAAAIALIVLLNAALGFFQEAAAERAVLALRESFPQRANVIREGRERELPAEAVVRGDLLVLREGDRVPADARLVEASALAADESALTGESLPVEKSTEPVAETAALGDRVSMVFAGTAITRGRAHALVVATGSGTELGRIAALTEKARPPVTPLQARLGRLALVLVAAGVLLVVVLAAGMLLRGSSAHEAFLVAVSVAVAAVPEGLAATVTIALALGARDMAERGAIVRRLAAIETMGEITLACTDKTGTLTENRLRVAAVLPAAGRSEGDVLAAGALASTAELVEEDEAFRIAGDPVEGALLLAALEAGLSRRVLLAGRTVAREIPFSPERRRMTVVYDEEDGRRALVKGAPEEILGRSTEAQAELDRLEEAAAAWSGEGLRVLAVAERRDLAHDLDEDAIETALVPLGLVALHDPLRAGAAAAVAQARRAGIRVWMLTGDHPATARTIGGALDLGEDQVFARVTPGDKLAIVERAQEHGDVVLVTGDGVNDAPALRRGDVGVAMGRSGTEAAREAADVVLSDDDFATIVAAIHEGRRVADNVRKFVAFLLSANLGEVVLFAIAVLGGLGVPMTVVQVLTVNILTDGLPALALARDPAAPDAMRRPPRPQSGSFGGAVGVALVALGVLVGLVGLVAYLAGRALGGDAEQTMAFATIALAELAFVFSCRSPLLPAWRLPPNRYLFGGVAISAAMLAAVVWIPLLQEPFGTVALGPTEVAIVTALSLVPALAAELAKAVRRAAT